MSQEEFPISMQTKKQKQNKTNKQTEGLLDIEWGKAVLMC